MSRMEIGTEFKVVGLPKPIGYFEHKPTNSQIAVFHRISKFQLWCIKKCFGLEYRENK